MRRGVWLGTPPRVDAKGRVGRGGPEQKDRLPEQCGAKVGRLERSAEPNDQREQVESRARRRAASELSFRLKGCEANESS